MSEAPQFSDNAKAFAKQAISMLERCVEQTSDTFDLSSLPQLSSHLLAIKRQAQSLGLSELNRCLTQLLTIVDSVLNNRLNLSNEIQTFCLFAMDECIQICQQIEQGKPVEHNEDINVSYEYIAASIIEAPPMHVDAIPLDIFYEELIEIVAMLNQLTADSVTESEMVSEAKRLLHTLKGSARLVGYKQLGDFMHDVETKLEQLPASACRELLQSITHLLSSQASLVLEGKPVKVGWDTLNASSATQSLTHLEKRDTQQKLRLPLSSVEHFGKLAASSNMMRSHAQLQLQALKVRVHSLTDSIRRLRDQTKQIELYALQRVKKVANDAYESDFDPLEMDRYTQLQYYVREAQDTTSHIASLHEDATQGICEIEDTLRDQGRASQQLEEGLRNVRMISFDSFVPRLSEMVKQISRELAKDIEFEVLAAEGELDRTVMEKLIPPFEHMLRNAIDHGIESREDRALCNKPPKGKIQVSMQRQGAYIMIEIRDDGVGLDLEAIKQIAYEKHWWQLDREPSQEELIQHIFLPGFSTSTSTTLVSGRGIGLDVVHAQIKKMGGHIKVETQIGMGSKFVIQLPFTSSLNQAFIFELDSRVYGVLISHVKAIIRIPNSKARRLCQSQESFEYLGVDYTLTDLSRRKTSVDYAQDREVPMLLVQAHHTHLAILIDKAVGAREILLQSIGPQMQYMDGFIGASILSTDQIALIIDPIGMMSEQSMIALTRQTASILKPRILVVDDSVTVRKVTERFLARHHFEVFKAKDGIDAIEVMLHTQIDCILLDLEMPRMDGFTFLKWLRAQPRFNQTAVIIISSRSMDKYKVKAKNLGVSNFLSKPYQEEMLIEQIHKSIGTRDDSPDH